MRPGDVVIAHDPQTAGLVGMLKRLGVTVVWRCHIGAEQTNALVEAAWDFLRPYLDEADAYVFSLRKYAPEWVPAERLGIIEPSVDPFSPKNEHLSSATVHSILARTGLLDGDGVSVPPTFPNRDGSTGVVSAGAEIVGEGGPIDPAAPLVLQVSRWDRLKDMAGVMRSFAGAVDVAESVLVLAGPEVSGVTDDPEGQEVLDECIQGWRSLPVTLRRRVRLAILPTGDVEANAAVVNALQRHAAVVAQKSLTEGFGLTVAEAMWKARPVVASAVGGIPSQIVDGETGILVMDPEDLEAFGRAVSMLLRDRPLARRLGEGAHQRVVERFLGDRQLLEYADLLSRLLEVRSYPVAP